MQMHCVGKGVYHRGPGGIEKPGDFGWRIYGPHVDESGKPTGRPGGIEIVLFCPRTGTCAQHVRQNVPNGDADGRRYWNWDGNWEHPTIAPSINCDGPRRCGAHLSISAGIAHGNWPTSWSRPETKD